MTPDKKETPFDAMAEHQKYLASLPTLPDDPAPRIAKDRADHWKQIEQRKQQQENLSAQARNDPRTQAERQEDGNMDAFRKRGMKPSVNWP
jgi:hypothetical protein